jgi:hypothetical protein
MGEGFYSPIIRSAKPVRPLMTPLLFKDKKIVRVRIEFAKQKASEKRKR